MTTPAPAAQPRPRPDLNSPIVGGTATHGYRSWPDTLGRAKRACARQVVREDGDAGDLRQLLSMLGLADDTPRGTRPADPGAATAELRSGEPG